MNNHAFFIYQTPLVAIHLGFKAFTPFSETVNNMLRTLIVALLLTFTIQSFGLAKEQSTPRITRAQYIAKWKAEAILQMHEHNIPASITLAQAILESGDGNSELARKGNNHFGIKCHDWTGKKVYHDDDKKQECFRKYDSAHGSFEDHSVFLKRSRYAFLFDYKITDYKSWAKGLKKAGYATNPKYPALLIRIIEENNLAQYDRMSPGKTAGRKKSKSANKPTSNSKSGEIEITINSGQKVYLSDNNIQYIITGSDTNVEKLANQLDLGPWQLTKYNDLKKRELIKEGSRIYIQPKRSKSKSYSTHVVATGETLRIISQLYGVKISKLVKYSGFESNYKVKPGDVVKLKR